MMTRIEEFSGRQLPQGWEWYFIPEQRQSHSIPSSSFSSTPPPTEAAVGYTHSLLFATFTGPLSPLQRVDSQTDKTATFVLLGRKQRGFGRGTFNGIGGKLTASESPLESILRESREETNLRLDPEKVCFAGRVKISVDGGEKVGIAVYTAHLSKRQERMVEHSEEVFPTWRRFTPPKECTEQDETGLEAMLPRERMRPEHKIYLVLLLHHHLVEDSEGKGIVFDLAVEFLPEPKKNELKEGQRPENCRTVRGWRLRLFHGPSFKREIKTTKDEGDQREEEEEEDWGSDSECSYGTFAHRDWS